MAAKVHIDTSAAHKALDELIEKAERVNIAAAKPASRVSAADPAAVAQALRRYERRNGGR